MTHIEKVGKMRKIHLSDRETGCGEGKQDGSNNNNNNNNNNDNDRKEKSRGGKTD